MKINIEKLPKIGDYIAFRTEIWSEKDKKKFSYTAKLSGTEMSISLSNGSLKSEAEAEEKLKQFSVGKAKKVYESGVFNDGDKIEIWFSPSWPSKLQE
jgi:hypothetical protein